MFVSHSPSLHTVLGVRFARSLVLAGAIGYAAGCLSHAMLYPIPDFPVPPPPAGRVERSLALSSGAASILWIDTSRHGVLDLLYLHGNGENLGTLAAGGFLAELRSMAPTHALDYPGYGRSTGRPSESENVEAVVLALGAIQAQRKRPLVLVGWSLGAAVAVGAAARSPGDLRGLVLMSPWYSLDSVARRHFPGWLVTLFRRESYDSAAKGRLLHMPVLVVHGREDSLIDFDEGRALSGIIPGARFVGVPAAGHNDLPGNRRAMAAVQEFLSGPAKEPSRARE